MGLSSGWYVIQVQTGRELAVCGLVERACMHEDEGGEPLVEECFSPQFRTRHKYRGEWRDITKLLLPGYIIAVTQAPGELSRRLRQVPEFAKVLSMGETFVPLREEERAWIDEFTRRGDRTVPMSIAVKDGDTITVTEGPLKGREGMIVRVNRKKCLAFLEFHIGGKRVTSVVGLGILRKPDEADVRAPLGAMAHASLAATGSNA